MTYQFTVGERVASTVSEAERKELSALFDMETDLAEKLGMEVDHDLIEQDRQNNANAPVVGDYGTILEIGEEGALRVEWDREIGPITGKRNSEREWFVSPDMIEPLTEEQAKAA